mgnify:CR=1 FL=1
MPYQRYKYALSVLGGLSLALAWLSPGTNLGALFGCLACAIFVLHIWIEEKVYYSFFATGVVAHLIAFHWLNRTIADFGGLSQPLPLIGFILFCLASSLQFPLFVLFYRNLPSLTERLNLRAALAWMLAEIIPIKIFPWHLGHSQLAWSYLSFSASWGSSLVIAFLMFWAFESIFKFLFLRQRRWALLAGPLALISALVVNAILMSKLDQTIAESAQIDTAIIQANIGIHEKSNLKYFEINRERYEELSQQVTASGDELLVIWPETAISKFLYTESLYFPVIMRTLTSTPNQAFLVGALTAANQKTLYNSALLTSNLNEPAQVYHKRILMPFGEYTPLANIFPFIKNLNPQAGEFSAGESAKIFSKTFASGITLKAAPLICYEDVISSPARESTELGANLLVNITNDAWFGQTVAPRQHNLIAAFRAIENQRYLIRSTNSGLTAIVDPFGQTTSELPIFSEGILRAKVPLLSGRTLFTHLGNIPWWILSGLVLALVVVSKSKKIVRKIRTHTGKK